ncbi:DNA-binding GntR family transcriptional regulator [Pararhizobium capsulatum DSM 1112]|uniref:DNA-binding GntR family transcriptional regulator n=1 Tax=Pararhizobium capsulatum DSM 1112 TaxID=1121113 RepID=A0ABU0BXP3_9HYPH|nr:GntR family transcriptional regulator [Pararhizobium capsulatum]MDQ0323043.1 DNA-binding GntR family transcriptional regulator [Pararhizobium capsulatum DSM 1112]
MDESISFPAARDGRDADRAFDAILKEILSGTLPAGMKLNEPDLSRRHGVKRGPLREAMRRLQGRNLVSYTPNAGARIVKHSAEDILQIYQVREGLESMAARLCAEHLTDVQIGDLRVAAAEGPFPEGLRPRNLEDRQSFHQQLVSRCGNAMIARVLDESFFQLLRLWRSNHSWLRHSDENSRADHMRIAEAIFYRDGDSAELLMRNHLRRLRLILVERVRNGNGLD